jgi:hypothetical protein
MATKKILIQVILDDKATKKLKGAEDAVQGLSSKVTILNKEQRQQIINDEKSAIQKRNLISTLKAEATEQMRVADATNNARAQAGLNNAILLETGRLASDANYGFTGMANNLGQLVSLFGSFVKTNNGVIASFKQLLSSLWGTGGFLIAVQLLISFMPRLDKLFKELSGRTLDLGETFEDAASGVADLAGNFEIYIGILQDATRSEEQHQLAIEKLNEEYPDFVDSLEKSGISMIDIQNNTKDAVDELEEYRKKILEIAYTEAAKDKIAEEQAKIIQKRIDLDDEAREKGIDNLEDYFQKYIDSEKEIERLEKMANSRRRNALIKRERESREEGTILAGQFLREKELREQNIETIRGFVKLQEGETKKETREKVKLLNEMGLSGVELNKLFLEGYTAQQVMAMEALAEGAKERDNKFAELDRQNKKRLKDLTNAEKAETKARIAIREGYFDAAKSVSDGLKALGDLDDGFKIAAIVTEKAEAIAKVIVKTKESNQIISAAGKARAMLGDPTAIPKSRARRLSNNISAGINIAGIVAAAAGGINAIKSKSSVGASLGGGGEAGEAGEVQAPDFNVVGAGGVSQLATTLAGVTGQPLKAFVVSKEISSAQELERNITTTASIG